MAKYIGTFGIGQKNQDAVQPIEALNLREAQFLMASKHGREWCMVYTHEAT